MPCARLHHLGLEQLELHAHRAQFVAQQELGVGEGQPVGALGPAVARGRRHATGVLLGGGEVAGGEVVALGSMGSRFVKARSLARVRRVAASGARCRTPGSRVWRAMHAICVHSMLRASSICSRPASERADAGQQLQRLGRLHAADDAHQRREHAHRRAARSPARVASGGKTQA